MTATNPSHNDNSNAPLHATTIESPVGDLRIVASDAGVRAVLWSSDDSSRVPLRTNLEGCESHSILAHAALELTEYFAGERQEFDVPLDPEGTEFQHQAWLALRAIPYGETVSYGEQAERMGDKNKARAVGAANGRNPISIIVPCHRVVGSNGSLTGFAGGIETKRWLLAHEQKVAGHTLL
jgi:methylated-DNA-[protein]-cysteine S-methyltransferase